MTKIELIKLLNNWSSDQSKANDLEYHDPKFKVYSQRAANQSKQIDDWINSIEFIEGVFTK